MLAPRTYSVDDGHVKQQLLPAPNANNVRQYISLRLETSWLAVHFGSLPRLGGDASEDIVRTRHCGMVAGGRPGAGGTESARFYWRAVAPTGA